MIVQLASHLAISAATTWCSEAISMVGANSLLFQVVTINAATTPSVGTAQLEGSIDKEIWTAIGTTGNLSAPIGVSIEKNNGPFGYAYARVKIVVTTAPFVLAIVGNTYSQ